MSGEGTRGRRKLKRILRWVFVATVVAFVVLTVANALGFPFPWRRGANETAVYFIDVGQGDAALILDGGHAVVIDVGPVSAMDKVTEFIRAYTRKIDLLLISHPHEDHVGALSGVLSAVRCDRIVMNADSAEGAFFTRALDVIEGKEIPVEEAKPGAVYEVAGIRVELLAPSSYFEDDKNSNSVVARAEVGGMSVLFTGDATAAEEADILRDSPDRLKSDVLKVAHHGSAYSSGEEFIRAVSPEIAVVSCAEANEYGHPHRSTLDRLRSVGAKIYRTDESGTVKVWRENGEIKVSVQG